MTGRNELIMIRENDRIILWSVVTDHIYDEMAPGYWLCNNIIATKRYFIYRLQAGHYIEMYIILQVYPFIAAGISIHRYRNDALLSY